MLLFHMHTDTVYPPTLSVNGGFLSPVRSPHSCFICTPTRYPTWRSIRPMRLLSCQYIHTGIYIRVNPDIYWNRSPSGGFPFRHILSLEMVCTYFRSPRSCFTCTTTRFPPSTSRTEYLFYMSISVHIPINISVYTYLYIYIYWTRFPSWGITLQQFF